MRREGDGGFSDVTTDVDRGNERAEVVDKTRENERKRVKRERERERVDS